METSPIGRAFITKFEGCRLTAYRCPAGVWTIGVGHTSKAGKPDVRPGMTIQASEADSILAADLRKFESCLNRRITVPLNQNQFDACLSLAFNIGTGAFEKSTLLRKLNAGDYVGAADEFQRWDKAGGRVLPGLTRRRIAEADLFRTVGGTVEADVVIPAPLIAEPAPTRPTGLLGAFASLFRKA